MVNFLPADPAAAIRLRCELCGRSGRYRAARFFTIAGTTNRADALIAFARAMGCPRAIAMRPTQMPDRCGIRYDLEA